MEEEDEERRTRGEESQETRRKGTQERRKEMEEGRNFRPNKMPRKNAAAKGKKTTKEKGAGKEIKSTEIGYSAEETTALRPGGRGNEATAHTGSPPNQKI